MASSSFNQKSPPNIGEAGLEANFKPLVPKSSQSSILNIQIGVHMNHEYYPSSNLLEHHHAYTNASQIVKAKF